MDRLEKHRHRHALYLLFEWHASDSSMSFKDWIEWRGQIAFRAKLRPSYWGFLKSMLIYVTSSTESLFKGPTVACLAQDLSSIGSRLRSCERDHPWDSATTIHFILFGKQLRKGLLSVPGRVAVCTGHLLEANLSAVRREKFKHRFRYMSAHYLIVFYTNSYFQQV